MDIPPYSSKRSDDISVDVHFFLIYIKDLDVTNQVLTVFGTLLLKWYDPLLTWNSSSPENPTHLQLKSSEIWTPTLQFSNNAGSPPDFKNAYIYTKGTGDVLMSLSDLFHTQCYIDVTRYPFDQQQCNIILNAVAGYSFQSSTVYSHAFERVTGKSVEWKVNNISSYIDTIPEHFGLLNVVKIKFILSREYTFYLLTVITPVSLLSLMNACAFLLPAESGEKISYLISILVTYAVFLNFINEVLPKSGIPSRLAIYLILVFCQSCAAILTTLGLLNMYHEADDKNLSITGSTPVGTMSTRDGGSRLEIQGSNGAKVSPTESDDNVTKVPKIRGKRWIKSLERKLFLVFLAFALLSFIPLFV
ncbi:acetylcholine receptor subunit beta-type acr-2-like [Haliotis rufescens]|uniref:acetylcholine receptor subunit beta-type acr-2-like n=1 Tax=Haliotis rufescens TaxID=6454 RepID=UPI00201EEB63|nr:acetylcholine receptor subunit beta-type acr-2-like [Haliotis rufescens]